MTCKGDLETVGFLRKVATFYNKAPTGERVSEVIDTYRAFFKRSGHEKGQIDMVRTGSDRSWDAAGSEQVNPLDWRFKIRVEGESRSLIKLLNLL